MKSLIFVIIIFSVVSARNYKDMKVNHCKIYKKSDRYFFFAGYNGKVHLIDSKEPPDEYAIKNYTCFKNKYWLYTRSNPIQKQVLIYEDIHSVQQSHFDAHKTTIFTSHGWKGDGEIPMNKLLAKVWLKRQHVNIIVLDWSILAHRTYLTAKLGVPKVGRMLGQFIWWLHKNFKLNLNRVHLVGHSLGGHVVGNAGKELKGRAARITALDPAGPLWYGDSSRVTKNDAKYVEIIHTNSYFCGYAYPCGHSDFYPNGGRKMPGCSCWDLSCNHARSWKYMAASIERNAFFAERCRSLKEVESNSCSAHGKRGHMGDVALRKHERGLYRGKTTAEYPFYPSLKLLILVNAY